MDFTLSEIPGFLHSAARSVGAEATSPWFYFQLGLLTAAAGVALAVSALIRSRIDVEALGKDWRPPLQRFVRVLVGSASVAVFAILMALARMTMVAVVGPSGSYLLSVATNLAFAWLIIRLVGSGIRNTFVVRVVSFAAFLVAALSILTSLLNWGLSLIFSGLLVRALARRTDLRMDYRAAGAAGCLGLGATWALGLSSSAAQLQANPASLPKALLDITGVIPFEQTIFLWQSMVIVAVLFVVSIVLALM